MSTEIITKLKVHKPAGEVFEAFVSPSKIGNFWFSTSSERWEEGKRIIVRYDEYNAEGIINVLEMKENKKILFSWGEEQGDITKVLITLEEQGGSTIIEVNESGLKEDDPDIMTKMLGQKEGWVYTLTCLKAYLENGLNNLRASLIH
jgi:uncharacterized protein YndB with AHSA1/START domain